MTREFWRTSKAFKLKVEKGDVIVLKCKGAISYDLAVRLKKQMERFCKAKKVKVMVIHNDMEFFRLKEGQLVSLDRERFV